MKLIDKIKDLYYHKKYPTPPKPYFNAYSSGPIWNWFGLTYANYLVLHRRTLQSMPLDWQEKFVEMLNELDDKFAHHYQDGGLNNYMVRRRNSSGKFVEDPLAQYRHADPLEIKE